ASHALRAGSGSCARTSGAACARATPTGSAVTRRAKSTATDRVRSLIGISREWDQWKFRPPSVPALPPGVTGGCGWPVLGVADAEAAPRALGVGGGSSDAEGSGGTAAALVVAGGGGAAVVA